MAESQEVDITLGVDKGDDQEAWRRRVARRLRIPPVRVASLELLKKSIDARKVPVQYRLRLRVGIDESLPPGKVEVPSFSRLCGDADRVVIVGCGPAGIFAALRCIQLGLRPVILERGKDASARRFDLAPILREGRVIEDSNYCFGEGGAGTFPMGSYTPGRPSVVRCGRSTRRWLPTGLLPRSLPRRIPISGQTFSRMW